MAFDIRALAIATAGFSAFVNLYSPQALLPGLAREFGVGAGEISALITASTAAIALTAPCTDAHHRAVDERGAAGVLAVRAGAVAAANLHRRRGLHRRRMAAG